MKFAHIGDCHLGGWRHPELKLLNFQSFQYALRFCIKEIVDFILIAGDLFDSAYPPIETLKETFQEFKKLKEARIPVFLIAGSHDYSVSGKTFLEVLEKSGFCKNVFKFQEKDGIKILEPTIYKNVAIYGYPGKKSGLEVGEIEKLRYQGAPGLFKILMLHTTIRDAVGDSPINAVDEKLLPQVDYLALAHLHIKYQRENRVYCGPTFPNNISELEELHHGFFYIYDNGKIKRKEINLKEVLPYSLEIRSSLGTTEEIISFFKDINVKDKIVILRLSGLLEKGKISDIDFQRIELFLKNKGAHLFLKTTSKLHMPESEFKTDISDYDNIELQIIDKFQEKRKSKFNPAISGLMSCLSTEKNEDETRLTFEDRLLSEAKKILAI